MMDQDPASHPGSGVKTLAPDQASLTLLATVTWFASAVVNPLWLTSASPPGSGTQDGFSQMSQEICFSLGMRTGFKSIGDVGFIIASLSQVPKGDSVWLLMGYSTGVCVCVLHVSICIYVCFMCVWLCVCVHVSVFVIDKFVCLYVVFPLLF